MSAVGFLDNIIGKTADLLAASPAFQSRVNAADAAAARASIYGPDYWFNDVATARPHAVVWVATANWTTVAAGAGNILRPSGSVDVYLTDNCRIRGDALADYLDFLGFVTGLIDDVRAACGVDDRLNGWEITLTDTPVPTRPTDYADGAGFWDCTLTITVGR